jgi:tetratricopeptide (TPR) repeat protein
MVAQIPRAEAVDPALAPDQANDRFLRGKNLYDSAQASTVLESRITYYQRAAQIFAAYLDAFPSHPNAEMAWWYLGNSYYQSGQIDDAKRCFSTLLNRFGKGKWAAAAAYTLAADYYNNGKYAFAAPLFERFAENAAKPEDGARGNFHAGTCYRLLGRDREAAKSFNKVVDDPAGVLFAPQAKLALAHIALKAGNQEEALGRFEDIVAETKYPAKYRGEAALYAALTATKLGKTELSDKYLDLILRSAGMDEFRPDAQTALMENLFAKKQYREVVEVFRRSSLTGVGEREANRLMIAGRATMRIKQYAEALQLFRDVEKQVKPETDLAFHAAYYRLLCFFQIEGRNVPEQVDAFLQLYRKARPGDSRIHTALMMKAESLFSTNDIAGAAKVYSQIDAAAVSDKNRPGLLYQRGWCLSEAGDPQGAIRSLSDFISKYPEDLRVPSAMAKRAKSYVDSGESAKAIADFDKLTGPGVAEELASFAWLESAHLRRTEANNADMILRYKGLLEAIKDLDPNLQAEANYWIGLGLVRTNVPKESVAYLEKARSLRPDAYSKHAGQLLALGYFASQNPQKLAEEINLAIAGNYEGDIPDPAVQWSGVQSYNAGDFSSAAKSLALVANPDEPRESPKEVWRYLAKSQLETGNAEAALIATNNVLEVEQDLGWKADGLLDRGRALFLLKRYSEARKAADEAADLHPQGRTSAGLRILSGDLSFQDKKLDLAGADYLNVVLLHEDKDLKPLALSKYIQVLIDQGKTDEVGKYRQQLQNEFPDWKEPGH